MPLRASASALSGKPSPTSSGRSPSSSARAASLEAEVAALRTQLAEQSEGHQSDMSALRAEQALRRAALEDALRAESAESERRLCLQFAEEATSFKVSADISLQQARAASRSAMRREMAVLRRQLEGLRGVLLLIGPPCSGKSVHAEVLSAQLGVQHASLGTLLQDSSAARGYGAAVRGGLADAPVLTDALVQRAASELPPGGVLEMLLRAAASADDRLLLLECPAHGSLLPQLLMRIEPVLILLVDATDRACLRRMQRRCRLAGQPTPPAAQMTSLVGTYRAVDERLARAYGKRHYGRLCVLDDRVALEEAPAIVAEALVHTLHKPRAHCGASAELSPVLVAGAGSSVGSIGGMGIEGSGGAGHVTGHVSEAAAMAGAMAAAWGLAHLSTSTHDEASAMGSEASALLLEAMLECAKRGQRCVISASPPTLPAALRALRRYSSERLAPALPAPSLPAPMAPTAAAIAPAVFRSGSSLSAAVATGQARATTPALSSPPSPLLAAIPPPPVSVEAPAAAAEPMCLAFIVSTDVPVTAGGRPSAVRLREVEGLRSTLRAAGLSHEALGATVAAVGAPAAKAEGFGAMVGASSPTSFSWQAALAAVAERLVTASLGLPRGAGPDAAATPSPTSIVPSPSPNVPSSVGAFNAAAHVTSSPGHVSSHVTLSYRPLDSWPGVDGSHLRGLIVVSGAEPPAAGSSKAAVEPSFCMRLAEKLGSAHVALPSLLREQLAALHKTSASCQLSRQLPGSTHPVDERGATISEGLRTGKLLSADSTLRAVQTAIHAAPEGLVLVEHSKTDSPLEHLVARIRPSLVLLVRPMAAAPPSPRNNGWANSLTDVDARQAYELRALEALGDDAPQEVRLCAAVVEEAAQLIFAHLSRDEMYEADEESDDEHLEYYGGYDLPLFKNVAEAALHPTC